MDIVYGVSLSGPDDEYIVQVERAAEQFNEMKVPGAFLADTLPILRHIPAWCPGGAAQRFASVHEPTMTSIRYEPFSLVKRDMVCPVCQPPVRSRPLTWPLQERGLNKRRIAHLMYEKLMHSKDQSNRASDEMSASGAAAIAYLGQTPFLDCP